MRAVEGGAGDGTEVREEVCGGNEGDKGGDVGEDGGEGGDGGVVEVVARGDRLDEGEGGVACADYGYGRGGELVAGVYC